MQNSQSNITPENAMKALKNIRQVFIAVGIVGILFCFFSVFSDGSFVTAYTTWKTYFSITFLIINLLTAVGILSVGLMLEKLVNKSTPKIIQYISSFLFAINSLGLFAIRNYHLSNFIFPIVLGILSKQLSLIFENLEKSKNNSVITNK